jgi:hypothetical protein
MVASGAYLIANSYQTLGGITMGLGVFGGMVSFLYQITLDQNKEKRRAEVFEISKGLLAKLLQAIQDVNVIAQKVDRTVH